MKAVPEAGVLAIDARGHGETQIGVPEATMSDGTLDLGLEALAGDMERAIEAVRVKMGWSKDIGAILVGHSLGGAVVAQVAKEKRLGVRVLGFAVLDVVEGSAMDALQSMQSYLSTRPRTFPTVELGIEWQYVSTFNATMRTHEHSWVVLLLTALPVYDHVRFATPYQLGFPYQLFSPLSSPTAILAHLLGVPAGRGELTLPPHNLFGRIGSLDYRQSSLPLAEGNFFCSQAPIVSIRS